METEQQDHLDRAEEQASLITTYNVQIEELKEQIQTLLGLIQEAKEGEQHHQSESVRISGEIANEVDTQQQLEADIDAKRLTFTQQREELKAVKSAVDKASKADRKKRHGGPSNGKLTLAVNDQQIHTLHALGDIHGWAPGLINYMRSHGLARLSIGGKELDDEGMLSLFPDPMERIAEQRDLPGWALTTIQVGVKTSHGLPPNCGGRAAQRDRADLLGRSRRQGRPQRIGLGNHAAIDPPEHGHALDASRQSRTDAHRR